MKLLEPITFANGRLTVKNRVVMPPMGMGYAHEDGRVSDKVIEYYRARAGSGVGMVVVENCIIDPDVLGVGPELQLHNEIHLPGLRQLADVIKGFGSVAGLQLNHMGRQTTLGKPVAPSPIPISEKGPAPRVLNLADIQFVIDEFVRAAAWVKQTGFDFVELHGAHGYLMCEFLSPVANRRDDEYGGDFERRLTFPLRIIKGIREVCGEGFPIQFRLSGSEYVPGGLTVDDTAKIAQRLSEAGVASISVSAGNWQTLRYIMAPMFMPPAYLADDASKIRAAVKIPVIAVGRIHSVKVAEEVLQAGKADMVAVGRGLIADPDWVRKLEEGRGDDIRPCISCNACVDLVSRAQEARCTVNAYSGREQDKLEAPPHKRHILVVGAGPAGMEAARIAAMRGHRVTLVEKGSKLGGKFIVSAVSSFEDRDEFVHQLSVGPEQENWEWKFIRIGCSIKNHCGNGSGSHHQRHRQLPGCTSDRRRATGSNVFVAEDVMLEKKKAGKRVAIVGGGGTGCEAAEWLVERGHEIAIFEMMAHIGANIEQITRRWMYYELRKAGAQLLTKSRVVRIAGEKLVYSDTNGDEKVYECDTVLIALGYRPTDDLAFCDDDGFSIPTYRIGDADRPGTILDAVTAGANIAARI